MAVANLTDTLKKKVEEARTETEVKLFKAFKNSKSVEEREAIYAKLAVLRDVTNTLINKLK